MVARLWGSRVVAGILSLALTVGLSGCTQVAPEVSAFFSLTDKNLPPAGSLDVTVERISGQDENTNQTPVVFEIHFGQVINTTTFDAGDLSNAGSAGSCAWTIIDSGDHKTFRLEANSPSSTSGTILPHLPIAMVQNTNGEDFHASTGSASVFYDVVQPTVVSMEPQGSLVISSLPADFDLEFSEEIAVSSLSVSDIVQSGTATGVIWSISNSGDNKHFTLKAMSATSDGTIHPSIAAGAVKDPAGNSNSAGSATQDVEYDATIPQIAFDAPSASPVRSASPALTYAFSVSGIATSALTAADLSLVKTGTAACSKAITGTHPNYHVELSNCTGNGTITPRFIAGVLLDNGGMNAQTDAAHAVTVDNSAPTLSVSAPNIAFANAASQIDFTVTYSNEDTISLSSGLVSLVGTNLAGCSTSVLTASDHTRTVRVTGCSAASGDVGVAISANSASDLAGNQAFGGLSSSNATIDNDRPTIAITGPGTSIANGSTVVAYTVTASGATSLAGGFSVHGSGGANCSMTIAGGGLTRTVSLSSCTGNGQVWFEVPQNDALDDAGNGSLQTLATAFTVDTQAPTLSGIDTTTPSGTYGRSFVVSLKATFSEDISLSSTGTLTLNSGVTLASTGVSGHDLLFSYTIDYGEFSAPNPLEVASSGALSATVTDLIGNPLSSATISLPTALATKSVFVNALKAQPVYENHKGWTSYVGYTDHSAGKNEYNQDDVDCDANQTVSARLPQTCLHGGELKKVVVKPYASCTGLTMTDSIGAFDWVCRLESGRPVFYSTGLKAGRGLRDLLSTGPVNWKTLSMTLIAGAQSVTGPADSSAWGDGLVELTNGTTLDTAGNVYYVTPATSTPATFVSVTANNVAFVTLGGASFLYGQVSASCAGVKTMVCLSGTKLGWIEGDFDASGGAASPIQGIYFPANSNLNRLHRSSFMNFTPGASAQAITLTSANGNRITEVKADGCYMNLSLTSSSYNMVESFTGQNANPGLAKGAIYLTSSNSNFFDQIRVTNVQSSNSTLYGISVNSSNTNVFSRVTLSNVKTSSGTTTGFNLSNSVGTILTQISIMGISGSGLVMTGSVANTTAKQISVSMTGSPAIQPGSGTGIFLGSAAINRADAQALSCGTGASSKIFHNLAITGAGGAISCSGSSVAESTGFIKTDNSCSGSGSNLDSNCDRTGVSHVNGISADFFKGVVGTKTWGSAIDWFNAVSSWVTGWTLNASTTGGCPSGSCSTYDIGLASNSPLLNLSGGDGLTTNTSFPVGGSCETLPGLDPADSKQLITANSKTFFMNAMEIPNDGIGNDDSLCEAGEDCIYAPHVGAYQGEGDYKSAAPCTFSALSVYANTRVYRYPTLFH